MVVAMETEEFKNLKGECMTLILDFLNFFFHSIGLAHMKDHQIHQGVVSTSLLRLAMAVLASHF